MDEASNATEDPSGAPETTSPPVFFRRYAALIDPHCNPRRAPGSILFRPAGLEQATGESIFALSVLRLSFEALLQPHHLTYRPVR